MENSYFFHHLTREYNDKEWFNSIKDYANDNYIQTYIVDRPLGNSKMEFIYDKAVVILIPGHKVIFLSLSDSDNDELDDYIEDFIEELTYRSLRFEYNNILGATRRWRRDYTEIISVTDIDFNNFEDFLDDFKFSDTDGKRKSDLLISLIINSINSIEQVGLDTPETLLERVKQKIILFDGDQTRFIFEKVHKNRITIQGLAGTGKTELLLHKLKELYTNGEENKIAFTCHSKTLNSSLRNRIPKFFDFMKVEEQIEWNERLFVFPSWGSESNKHTGLYSYICNTYNIPFYRYSRYGTFQNVCAAAIKDLNSLTNIEPCLDYILIDESQDFPEEFFELCQMVVKKAVFIAGDIFQNITDNDLKEVHPDYLLNRCYRTDPKTLMFAHAVGMGLFERPAIRWLNDEEWEACGYKHEARPVKGDREEYVLSRQPIRRFEDTEEYNVAATKLVRIPGEDFRNDVLKVISEIKANHSTVKPDDIAIVFLNQQDINYSLIDSLGIKIYNEFGWQINKAYEHKEIVKDKVFVSNRYNIKGLEFPFLICISNLSMTKNPRFRNTLYMTLTRSFITSYLVINERIYPEIDNLEMGLERILESNSLVIPKPKPDEILLSEEAIILQDQRYKSQNEIFLEVCDELKVAPEKREELKRLIQLLASDSHDRELIKEIIVKNKGYMQL
ncbi:DEAD/DEAH box helicase family protein [Paenibacillus lautus]|uniref:DEAD/DEAH box helicase family protein n=1 Tax=Paenibacillus lautus TaxID=1401 RepID=UPI001C0FB2B9|nr:DEAD/DEAH box helicase family protein [Paenibacillus lautus]MBU5349143.1 AAA family ATPase [Paenibacillus lautus]